MNKQPLGARKSGTPQSNQKTLTSFLRPRLPSQAKEECRVAKSTLASQTMKKTLNAGDSSDEDDLALLGQILPTPKRARRQFSHVEIQSPEKARPNSAGTLHSASSPPAKAPTFVGNFNLQALLADRESRNHEKAALARLEDSSWSSKALPRDIPSGLPEEAPPIDRQGTAIAGDVQHWSACDMNLAQLMTGRDLRRISRQLPKALMISSEDQFAAMASNDLLLEFVRLHGWSTFPIDTTRHLYSMLIQAKDLDEAISIARLVSTSTQLNETTLTTVFEALGVQSPKAEGLREVFSAQKRLKESSHLHDYKLQLVLQALHSQITKLSQKSSSADRSVIEKIILLAVILCQDCTYGPKIVSQAEVLLSKCNEQIQSFSDELICKLHNSTKIAAVQVGIVRSIPPTTPHIVDQVQMLSYCFLTKDNFEGLLSPAQRLDRLSQHISQSRPFHPIDQSTSFGDLKNQIALLNCATSTIPASCFAQTTNLIQQLQTLHGRIQDGKAAFIERSEAKAAIQRLADRLKYTLESSRKVNIFDKFRQ